MLRFGLSSFPPNLQPWANTGTAAATAKLLIHRGLLSYGKDGQLRGELAEEIEDYRSEGLVPVMGELVELRDAMSLVWRMLLLWLALLALLVIAGWVS